MTNVIGRVREIKQPRGGYIKPSEFEVTVFDDGMILNEENVDSSIVGMVVDYLTRIVLGTDRVEAFEISLRGAKRAEQFGKEQSFDIAVKLLAGIKGIDDKSVINACKLVTFDVWFRNPINAMSVKKDYNETNADKNTIENIQTLVKRSISFFEKYGPITKSGFTFEPVDANKDIYAKMIKDSKGSYGGYTPTVISGDGDFLTKDTLWDFKVSKFKPTNKQTLQLLMYWIMGQHSGQEIFRNISKLGIFNPRLNSVYLLDITKVSADIIKTVEDDVICYEN